MRSLFDPVRLGAIACPNRIFMAPLTRGRGSRNHVPTPVMSDYYSQRAGAGLIISEAIGISQQGLGWPYATGLWREDQVAGWQQVTQAVHAAGGRIIAQIWHMGRMVHPSFAGGEVPVSASPTQAPGRAHTYSGRAPYPVARSAKLSEIKGYLLDDHRRAAENAMIAGFDGVQVHAANGYLIDQFLRDNANLRTDLYGGSICNRLRFLREVTEAVTREIGADRTAVRLSPNGNAQGVNDSAPELLFAQAGAMLNDLGIAFLELREPPRNGSLFQGDREPIAPRIRETFKGILVLNSDLTGADAAELLESRAADAVSFGRSFISNPDLPARLRRGIALTPWDKATFYGRDSVGYTDYPPA